MSEHCPQDGGFIGECGCTHPNHEHSELVKGLLADAKTPHDISPAECEAALEEGFYVNSRFNTRVGFGRRLLGHIENDHDPDEADTRKAMLLYAVNTVRQGRRGPNPKGGPDSYAYARQFDGFGILVCTDKDGIAEVAFTFYDTASRGLSSGSGSHISGQLSYAQNTASAISRSSASVQRGVPSAWNPNAGLRNNSLSTRPTSSAVHASGRRTLHRVSSRIRGMAASPSAPHSTTSSIGVQP